MAAVREEWWLERNGDGAIEVRMRIEMWGGTTRVVRVLAVLAGKELKMLKLIPVRS